MEFNVRRNSIYKEMTVVSGDASITSGLLDVPEQIRLVIELISAAEDLLPVETNDAMYELSTIRTELEKREKDESAKATT